uniref:Uncharacterized protein n=1 Tax=Aureoumbra lagunensis TaxID=44058 RepID=A0A7S3K349_9STRA
MDWLDGEEDSKNLNLAFQELLRRIRSTTLSSLTGWSQLRLAGIVENGTEFFTWADDWISRLRCQGIESLWSTEIAKSKRSSMRRSLNDLCITNLRKPVFSCQALFLATIGGFVCGYAFRRWIEPAIKSAWQRMTKALHLWWLETCIAASRLFDRLAFWRRSRNNEANKTSRERRPSRSNSKQRILNREASIKGHVDVVENESKVPIDPDILRGRLQEGDLVCLTYDDESYSLRCEPTFTIRASQSRQDKAKLLQRKASGRNVSEGRVVDDCSLALASFTIYDENTQAFLSASSDYVNKSQRTRFTLALRRLEQINYACVAILRLVRAPNEPTEPPRDGDLFIIWNPSDNPTRSVADRKATTPVIVNQLFNALNETRVLASFTFRAEAQSIAELDYDFLYRKLFQVAIVR